MKPLAYTMRPTHYDDVVGQEHLVGKNGVLRKMIEQNHLFSFILYGDPGCGKTTIAESTCQMLNCPSFRFNASIDNKDKLKKIISEAKYYDNSIIVVDEIHRMKKDIQDYLLPSVENGEVILIGLTTVNPYHSINPAVRSRCHIYRLNPLTENDLKKVLLKAKDILECDKTITDEVYDFIIATSGKEIRTAINLFETLVKTSSDTITLEDALRLKTTSSVAIDKNADYYYDILSGLQKSIRGSDVDAALHYLAVLLVAGDLEIINRRLRAIAYEDIGLANPAIGPRLDAAINSAMALGLPEARLPYSVIVIELALSPKSNSAYLAIDKAIADVEKGLGGQLPLHLKNTFSFNPNQKDYQYPHDYPSSWVYQQYLPDNLVNAKYYEPKNSSKAEKQIKDRYDLIESWKKMSKE